MKTQNIPMSVIAGRALAGILKRERAQAFNGANLTQLKEFRNEMAKLPTDLDKAHEIVQEKMWEIAEDHHLISLAGDTLTAEENLQAEMINAMQVYLEYMLDN